MESAHGNPELQPELVKEFTVNGVTYMYEYSRLVKQQVDMATAVYEYRIDRQKKQASNSLQEYFISQSMNYDVYVLSLILLKKKDNGDIEPFPTNPNVMEWEKSDAFKFAANLPVKYESEVEEVISDFFGKPARYMIGSQIRGSLISDFVASMVSQFQNTMDKSQKLSDFQELITRASSIGDSEKPVPEAETGS